jgi:hypothetical protein
LRRAGSIQVVGAGFIQQFNVLNTDRPPLAENTSHPRVLAIVVKPQIRLKVIPSRWDVEREAGIERPGLFVDFQKILIEGSWNNGLRIRTAQLACGVGGWRGGTRWRGRRRAICLRLRVRRIWCAGSGRIIGRRGCWSWRRVAWGGRSRRRSVGSYGAIGRRRLSRRGINCSCTSRGRNCRVGGSRVRAHGSSPVGALRECRLQWSQSDDRDKKKGRNINDGPRRMTSSYSPSLKTRTIKSHGGAGFAFSLYLDSSKAL